jgi:hypothetical protein
MFDSDVMNLMRIRNGEKRVVGRIYNNDAVLVMRSAAVMTSMVC